LFSLSFHDSWQPFPGGECVLALFSVGEKEITSLLSNVVEFHNLWCYVIFQYGQA